MFVEHDAMDEAMRAHTPELSETGRGRAGRERPPAASQASPLKRIRSLSLACFFGLRAARAGPVHLVYGLHRTPPTPGPGHLFFFLFFLTTGHRLRAVLAQGSKSKSQTQHSFPLLLLLID